MRLQLSVVPKRSIRLFSSARLLAADAAGKTCTLMISPRQLAFSLADRSTLFSTHFDCPTLVPYLPYWTYAPGVTLAFVILNPGSFAHHHPHKCKSAYESVNPFLEPTARTLHTSR